MPGSGWLAFRVETGICSLRNQHARPKPPVAGADYQASGGFELMIRRNSAWTGSYLSAKVKLPGMYMKRGYREA
jgi:hypothetical protein